MSATNTLFINKFISQSTSESLEKLKSDFYKEEILSALAGYK